MGCRWLPRARLGLLVVAVALACAAIESADAQEAPMLGPLAAETMLFYSEGPALLVTTETWSILAPLVDKPDAARKTGIFFSGGEIYNFKAPIILKVGGCSPAGISRYCVPRPRWCSWRRPLLLPLPLPPAAHARADS
jgi:hypothetical protein